MLDIPGFFVYLYIMEREKLKIGQIVKLDSYDFTKKLFKIVGFTPKRIKVIRLSTGYDCHWYIVSSTITEIVE